MAASFPALRILREDFHREPFQDTTVVRSPEGGRLATAWASGIRWRFWVATTSDDELDALVRHFNEDALGRLNTFNFGCPDQGGQFLVEYDMDSLDVEPTGPTTHRAQITLRTVAG